MLGNVVAREILGSAAGPIYRERELVIDNVIGLPGRDDEVQLRQWLAYALRKDLSRIDPQHVKDASKVVDDLSFPGNALPECLAASLGERGILAAGMERLVLHKAVLGVYRLNRGIRRPSGAWKFE